MCIKYIINLQNKIDFILFYKLTKGYRFVSYIDKISVKVGIRKSKRILHRTVPSESWSVAFLLELSLGKGPWLNAISVKASNPTTRVKIPTRRALTSGTYAALGFRCLLWWLHYLSKYLPNVTRRPANGQSMWSSTNYSIRDVPLNPVRTSPN